MSLALGCTESKETRNMEDVAKGSSKIKNNVSKWENEIECLAPLTTLERDSIIELTQATYWRPLKYSSAAVGVGLSECTASTETELHLNNVSLENDSDRSTVLPSESSEVEATEKKLIKNIQKFSINVSKIDSSQQFLNWYAGVEEEMEREQDVSYHDYVNQLENHRRECQTLLDQLNQALDNLNNLTDQYTSVSLKTNALHTDCEHLLAEQTRLSNGANTVESRLAFFTEVNKISQKLNSPAFQVTSDGFIPLLAKIDECISYMNSNPTYLESAVYLAKYKQCLNRALSMVKFYVTKSLENTMRQVSPHPESAKPTSDNALVLYYGKFRTNAPRINALMTEIEDRVEGSSEYENLLSDCHQCYFTQRRSLLEPCVADAILQLTQKYRKDYCSLVRSGCAFLVHVCEDEHNLYHQFFSLPSPELEKFLQGLCSVLYDTLRPLIIHIDHLETLSELCSILRRGMIEEHIQNNPTQLAPLTSVVSQLLEDCQERLVYRAHIYMQSDIANFKPSPGDLAYPSKLEMMESIAESLLSQQKQEMLHRRNNSVSSMTSVRSSTSEEVASFNSHATEERFSRVGSSPADLHGMWYPTLRRTLMCLSKVYRCVDRSIFQGLSLEALSACMQSLSDASAGIAKTSSSLDAQLFEIKHLLIMREQLAPFQVDSSLREMTLDWSRLKEAAIGLVHKRNRLFSLTSNNSLLEFIVEGTPHVTEHILDSKRDVDNQLKKICEQLISTSTETLVGPISAFLAKADVILNMNREKDVKPVSLKNQPFAVPEKVADVVTHTQKKMRQHIPVLQRRLQLYLANRDTEFILFKPIRNNILSTFGKLRQLLEDNYSEEDRLIIASPTHDETVALISSLFKT